ncbi:MAG: GntR family transcriptional regulator [Phycisphaeraceae bacterium]|nr:GntR family transcriptional regulator [Phycisphaeraceae bacterium]
MSTLTVPKYQRVKRQLIQKIESGKFPPGSPFPSEHQLLKLYDVSRPTLIRSLQELVNDGYLTRQRGKGTFVAKRQHPNESPYGKAASPTSPLTVFISEDIANLSGPAREIQLRILRGIQEALGNAYNSAAIRHTPRNAVDPQTLAFLETTPPGIAMLIEPSCFTTLKPMLCEHGWEIWSINEKTDDGHCVYIDQQHAGYLATRFLIDAGRTKIALLNGPCHTYWGFEARKQGYLQALNEAGILPQKTRILEMHHSIDSEAGRTMMRQLLKNKVDLDGVVGASDSKAMGAMAHARECKIDVPSQIMFVSIDNTLAEQADPPLPAVAMPLEAMGYQAASLAQLTWTHRKMFTPYISQTCLRPSLIER